MATWLKIALASLVLFALRTAMAEDLGYFSDGTYNNGARNIRVYLTESRLVVRGYGATWVYNKVPGTSNQFKSEENLTAEVLGNDAILWQDRIDHKPVLLLNTMRCEVVYRKP